MQKGTEYALIHTMQPKPVLKTRKGNNATECIKLNRIEEDFRLPLLLLMLKLIILGNRLQHRKIMDSISEKD